MSPRVRQTSMARLPAGERGSRRSVPQFASRNSSGSELVTPIAFENDMSEYASRSRSHTLRSDDSMLWNGAFTGQYLGHDDGQLDSLRMDTLPLPDGQYMMPVMSGTHCYDAHHFDQFTQGPMSQTLTGTLLESPYQDVLLGDDMMQGSPVSMDFSGYGPSSQHTWRHGQLSPPAEIFHTGLNDFPMDPTCDMPFQVLPESAVPGALSLDRMSSSVARLGQPRPLRSASERSHSSPETMAPQDIHYPRNDRADKVKARNDHRYDVGPDKDGYYHCPMLGEGSCTHKPTKQKCIYAKYLDSHLKPYVCTHGEKGSECDGARFSSNACLFRHEREAHGMHNHGLNPYLCLFPGCERSRQGNGFPRRWNQRDHMKRVHDWEEPEGSGNDMHDRSAPLETNKRKKSGHSHAVPMKRSGSSHAKSAAAAYSHGHRHSVSLPRYATEADKQLNATLAAYPMDFNDVQYSHVQSYQPYTGTSETYPNNYLVAH